MGRRGPKPRDLHARTLRVPRKHHEVYELKAKQAGMDWNGYVAWALAQFHGLETDAAPESGDQLALAEAPEQQGRGPARPDDEHQLWGHVLAAADARGPGPTACTRMEGVA